MADAEGVGPGGWALPEEPPAELTLAGNSCLRSSNIHLAKQIASSFS